MSNPYRDVEEKPKSSKPDWKDRNQDKVYALSSALLGVSSVFMVIGGAPVVGLVMGTLALFYTGLPDSDRDKKMNKK